MFSYEFLQSYWWLLNSVLGALLVFLLFVQGGQSLILSAPSQDGRNVIVNAVGRKWEFTFTMLVVFGGAFFASFPLFYSTSFGGAYWLWMLILAGFVLQAVSYEFRLRSGNIYGTTTYDIILTLHGIVAPVLLGVAVAGFFFGAEFVVERVSLVGEGSPVISTWSDTHGIEAIFSVKNLLLGFTVLFLARVQAILFLKKTTQVSSEFAAWCQRQLIINAAIFVVFFLAFVGVLVTADGLRTTGLHQFEVEPYRYLHNLVEMWWVAAVLLLGVVLVLYGIIRSALVSTYTCGIWFTGTGTLLVVMALFWLAGYNDTPYYPSLLDATSSLTIRNSSSSEFTLQVMSIVSLIIPFVAAYMIYAWHSLTRQPITPDELGGNDHKY